jgi:hypothetical protein
MWPACYSLWINWTNSITCTHCNVISLEHDSIPWRTKSQRINVDTTTFHLLWQLFTIIKIFQIHLNWIEKFGCQKPTKYGQFHFTSYENYLQSSKSFQVSLNWIEKFGCQKPTKYGQFIFYEAVKNDMANSKETSFNNTISSTLSLITVLFEDLFESHQHTSSIMWWKGGP